MRGMFRISRKTATIGVASAAEIAVIVGVLIAGSANAVSPGTHTRAASSPSMLSRAATAADAVPARGQSNLDRAGDGGINAENTRSAGSDANGKYRVGKDNAGNVCMLAETWGEGMTTVCATPEVFANQGLSMNIEGKTPTEYTEVYLIPDDIDNAAVAAQTGLKSVSKGLLTGDTRGHATHEYAFGSKVSKSAGSFTLRLMTPNQE
jgi:hypothetical protein